MNYEVCGPGQAPITGLKVGDFLLVDRGKYAGRLIRWGQGVRFRGADRIYAQWNHAALVVSESGALTEALVKTGVTRSMISKYLGVRYVVVHTNGASNDQQHLLRYSDRSVGEDYGFGNCLCVILGYLTFNRVCIGVQSPNCSAHVARGQLRLGAYFDRMPEGLAPADLARYYSVVVP